MLLESRLLDTDLPSIETTIWCHKADSCDEWGAAKHHGENGCTFRGKNRSVCCTFPHVLKIKEYICVKKTGQIRMLWIFGIHLHWSALLFYAIFYILCNKVEKKRVTASLCECSSHFSSKSRDILLLSTLCVMEIPPASWKTLWPFHAENFVRG